MYACIAGLCGIYLKMHRNLLKIPNKSKKISPNRAALLGEINRLLSGLIT